MKWLVTGGCGFIGCHLVQGLDDVIVIDDGKHGHELFQQQCPHAHLIKGDVRDYSMASQIQNVDIIVHLAANTGVEPSIEDPHGDAKTNILGTINYLEVAKRCNATFILASSGAVMGDTTPPLDESKHPNPISPYGASKLACEYYCHVYHACFDVHTVVLRFSNVYGPRANHKESFIARSIRKIQRGESIEVYGDGEQTRDFLHVKDLCRAILQSTKGKGIYHVSTGCPTSINKVISIIRQYVTFCNVIYLDKRKGDIYHNYAYNDKIKSLGWKPKISLEQGIKELLS